MSNTTTDQNVKGKLVSREVVSCVSELVSFLLEKPEIAEELQEVCYAPDYSVGIENQIDEMSTLECFEYLRDNTNETIKGNSKKQLLRYINQSEEEKQYFIDEYQIDPDYIESLEFWQVTEHMGEKLQEKGEPVIEFHGLTIWGRSCSGQAILLDQVINDIAKDMEILEGQINHKYWADKAYSTSETQRENQEVK